MGITSGSCDKIRMIRNNCEMKSVWRDRQSLATVAVHRCEDAPRILHSTKTGLAPAVPVNTERFKALVSSRPNPNEYSGALVSAPEHPIACSLSSYAIRSSAFLRSALEYSLV